MDTKALVKEVLTDAYLMLYEIRQVQESARRNDSEIDLSCSFNNVCTEPRQVCLGHPSECCEQPTCCKYKV